MTEATATATATAIRHTAEQGARDPLRILRDQDADRVPELVRVRWDRMPASESAYFRGSGAVMAADLAGQPTSGLTVQLCGDAHLENFGPFASAERRLVFDVNDFDQTHPGPFEWDLKRLAASVEVTGRSLDLSGRDRRTAVLAAAEGYRLAMADFTGLDMLPLWYVRPDITAVRRELRSNLKAARNAEPAAAVDKAPSRTHLRSLKKLTETHHGRRRIIHDPPLVVPARKLTDGDRSQDLAEQVRSLLSRSRGTLPPDVRHLFDQFELVDVARKVVGVDSVGTRTWIALLIDRGTGAPLFLQIKEATEPVVVEYGGRPAAGPVHQGERVVQGQRLMQTSGDILLGWSRTRVDGRVRDFYVRQLADWKGSVHPVRMGRRALPEYARICAWTLARAHARSGDRFAVYALVSGDPDFDEALHDFAVEYADRNSLDLVAARKGRDESLATRGKRAS